MKVDNAIKGFIKAGFMVTESTYRKGTYYADKVGYDRIKFHRNGADSDEMSSCYYLGPDYEPPYSHSLPQAIKWAKMPDTASTLQRCNASCSPETWAENLPVD